MLRATCGVVTKSYPRLISSGVRKSLDHHAHPGPLGMPENQARPGFLGNAEQIQFSSQLAVVPLLGLFDLGQIGFEFLLAQEGGAVDALQLLSVLVPFQ